MHLMSVIERTDSKTLRFFFSAFYSALLLEKYVMDTYKVIYSLPKYVTMLFTVELNNQNKTTKLIRQFSSMSQASK